MKFTIFLPFLFFLSCTHKQETLVSNVAYDEMANGNITASVARSVGKQDVCFDIIIKMKNVPESEASASNWTAAWIDGNSRYHLLSMHQRDPASEPEGSYAQWTNRFKTCTPKDRQDQVKYLILAPKELSYKESEGMQLEWK